MLRGISRSTLENPQISRKRTRVRDSRKMQPLVDNDFEVNQTKIKGGSQSGRKVVTHDSKSDLPLACLARRPQRSDLHQYATRTAGHNQNAYVGTYIL